MALKARIANWRMGVRDLVVDLGGHVQFRCLVQVLVAKS